MKLTATILLIEGNRANHPSFGPGLKKRNFRVFSVSNGTNALTRLIEIDPDIIVIDAESLRTSGKRIRQSLRDEMDDIPIILISPPDDSNRSSNGSNGSIGKDVTLVLPFTIQKLINRIKPLLPGDGKEVLHKGPIWLDLEHHRVRCMNNSGKLTHHLEKLLKYLMDHPGEVIERDGLFRYVWDTEYTADTRTLDVHISWLRKIIEPDPRHPIFIITIRGVGYRLDV